MSAPLVLVTGGAGFIGSNIVASLAEEGRYSVAVCDRLRQTAAGKWRNIAKHAVDDVVAPEQLWDWLAARAGEIEAIVHMGAVSSTTEPDADLIVQSNFVLSRDLWRWCAEHGKRLIYASSAATYGAGEHGFDDCDDPSALARLRPMNAYGWSKWLFDLKAMRERAEGLGPPQAVGLKFFNVYGPNEGHKGAMKSVVAQIWPRAREGQAVTLFKSHRPDYADGGQMRDFVYVRDVVEVVRWLLAAAQINGVFNLGSGQARSFADLAAATFRAAGHEPAIVYADMPEAIRDKYQYFTEARMERLRLAGYDRPMTSLEDGVGDYVRRFLSQADPYR
ncbi:MAG TPA: ADP-glyceromanno-heptose 6-epimerase [Caulobacteraceae bacterium]|nr:ADP-glyceromanno-heptose 6-epimerase [Caulobacteraceae bacterium]